MGWSNEFYRRLQEALGLSEVGDVPDPLAGPEPAAPLVTPPVIPPTHPSQWVRDHGLAGPPDSSTKPADGYYYGTLALERARAHRPACREGDGLAGPDDYAMVVGRDGRITYHPIEGLGTMCVIGELYRDRRIVTAGIVNIPAESLAP